MRDHLTAKLTQNKVYFTIKRHLRNGFELRSMAVWQTQINNKPRREADWIFELM